MESFCGNCGATKSAAAKFCTRCGSAFEGHQNDVPLAGTEVADPQEADKVSALKNWAHSACSALLLSISTGSKGDHGRVVFQDFGIEVVLVIVAMTLAVGLFIYLKRASHLAMTITLAVMAVLGVLSVGLNLADDVYSEYSTLDWIAEVMFCLMIFSLWMLVRINKSR